MLEFNHLKRGVRKRVGDSTWRRLRAVACLPALLIAAVTGDLPRLASYYRTDKWGDHWYAKHYRWHLKQYRWKPVNLLEIGVGGHEDNRAGGASLRMWKRFLPLGQIYGLDIYDKSAFAESRIHIIQGDQTDAELLRELANRIGGLDIVIDDGSHINEHVRASFEVLFPLLADGGMYVIEDTQTSFWPEFGGSEEPGAEGTTLSWVRDLVLGLNHAEILDESYAPSYTDSHVTAVHCYHNLVFVQKGHNDERSNKREALPDRFAR